LNRGAKGTGGRNRASTSGTAGYGLTPHQRLDRGAVSLVCNNRASWDFVTPVQGLGPPTAKALEGVAGRFIHDGRARRIGLDIEPEQTGVGLPFLLHLLMIGGPLAADGDQILAKLRFTSIPSRGTKPVDVSVAILVRATLCVEAIGIGQSSGWSRCHPYVKTISRDMYNLRSSLSRFSDLLPHGGVAAMSLCMLHPACVFRVHRGHPTAYRQQSRQNRHGQQQGRDGRRLVSGFRAERAPAWHCIRIPSFGMP
jgi:hypothetical protein